MKLLLNNFSFNSSKEFDIALPCVESTRDTSCIGKNEKCCGVYAVLSGVNIGLAAFGGQLFVMFGERVLEVDESLSVHCTTVEQNGKLVIEKEGEQYSVEYVNDSIPVSTPYYSEEAEDADFGLWLSRVLSSSERKRTILRAWANCDL